MNQPTFNTPTFNTCPEFLKERTEVLKEIAKGADDFTCPECHGEGFIEWLDDHSVLPYSDTCDICSGEGTLGLEAICEQYDIECNQWSDGPNSVTMVDLHQPWGGE